MTTPDAVEAAASLPTLTTDDVRAAYIGPDALWPDSLIEAEFDRWLAEHDAQRAVSWALSEAARCGAHIDADTADWLRDRAATLTPKEN